jgi:23S rRNA (uridine2552-2'-O)-methyltransferase
LIREGDVVLDVGCHPGGWAQVAVELIGDEGAVIGVDLEPCQPVEGATLLVGDITEDLTQERILEELEGRPINTIISDISPDITGKWDVDQTVAMTLVADVFDFSMKLLCKGGSFTTKLFQGVGVEELIKAVKPYFSTVRRFSPDASRNSSSEVYLVCRNFMPWMLNKNVKIRDTYEELLEPKLSGNEIDDGPDEVFSSFQVRKKKD